MTHEDTHPRPDAPLRCHRWPDYLNPPDGPHGPVLDATLFCPLMAGRSTDDADKLHVHRMAKGDKWRVVKRTFNTTETDKRRTNISRLDILKAAGLS